MSLKTYIFKKISSEKGLTLIEVLASIVIIAIIFGPFINMFIQSAKSNQIAREIIDATYIAQGYMEEVYNMSQSVTITNALNSFNDDDFTETVLIADEDYRLNKEVSGFYVEIDILSSSMAYNLVNVIVKIYNNDTYERLESQMESIVVWDNW